MKSVGKIAASFLRLGVLAFGGPAAHLAMMEEEFVRRRGWLTRDEFVDMIGAANLVPGPSSTEVAIHIGLRCGGLRGMLVAGACFILPASFLVTTLAWTYVRFGSLPSFQSALFGIKPVVVAVVAQAVYLLVAKVLDTWPKRFVLVVGGVLSWLAVNAIVVLFGAGVALGALALRQTRDWRSAFPVAQLLGAVAAVAAFPLLWSVTVHLPHPQPITIFLYFLKVGSVLYGSGYVLLAFLDHDLVAHWRWLSHGQLLDAIAVGQFTPGPVFTTATFIGFVLNGAPGAVAATVGIFLPAFLFIGISGRLLPAVRRSPISSGFLDGVNAAALALIAVVLIRLGIDAFRDWVSLAIAVVAGVLLLRFRVNSAILIVGGAIAGIAWRRLGGS